MRTKNGFTLRNVCGEKLIVPEGEENIDFCSIVSLNGSAAYLWEKVNGADFDCERLASLLVEEYEVDFDTALADAKEIASEWKNIGIAE